MLCLPKRIWMLLMLAWMDQFWSWAINQLNLIFALLISFSVYVWSCCFIQSLALPLKICRVPSFKLHDFFHNINIWIDSYTLCFSGVKVEWNATRLFRLRLLWKTSDNLSLIKRKLICHIKTVVIKLNTAHKWANKHQIWAAFICSVNIALVLLLTSRVVV